MNPKIAGVLVTHHEVAQLVSCGRPATAGLALEAHDRHCDIAFDHRCALPRDISNQDILPGSLAQLHE